MRIAVFDYKVILNNPAGSVHWQLLNALCREHEFTVFATEFDNPCPDRIRFVRVPVMTRPLWVLFILFHLVAPVCYWIERFRRGRFDRVQMVESNLSFGDICYGHFCHRAFYKEHRSVIDASTLRGKMRLLDHWLHALVEPWVFRRVRQIVVVSEGLGREMRREYPFTAGKITRISNPIDVAKLRHRGDFKRCEFRQNLAVGPDERLLSFLALGHFERKGLPYVLEAMQTLNHPRLKLVVVGGENNLVAAYQARCQQMGLSQKVMFAGMQKNVKPYLWASDLFVLPSRYETFSLATFEAAAAGVPVLVSPLHGVEELVVNGSNGLIVEPSTRGVKQGLQQFVDMSDEALRQMGQTASASVEPFGLDTFVGRWRQLYDH